MRPEKLKETDSKSTFWREKGVKKVLEGE